MNRIIAYAIFGSIATAVELNNISIDFYNHAIYTTAMEFCHYASNIFMTLSHFDLQNMPDFFDSHSIEKLSSKIEYARAQLQTMGSNDITGISTLGCNEGFLSVLDGIRLELNSYSSPSDDYAAVLYNSALIYLRTESFECAKQVLEFVLSMVSTRESSHVN